MVFKRIYDEGLAQASYFIGCQATGEAVVVDARRDIEVYLREAEAQQMSIRAVTETHIHADYLSGSRELAAATGAPLHLSAEGDAEWRYRFAHRPLRDGDAIRVGNLTLRAVHTPGHTPEHLSFLLTDGAASTEPGFLLSGDFVFVGDVGRPDLLDESGLGSDTREPMARRLFESLKASFWTLPDWVQVWPGHGAGSACGKALGAVASSTVGYEKLTAWWAPYLAQDDVEGFVAALLEGQPDAPAYFGRMKRQNRQGPALLGERPPLRRYRPAELQGRLGREFVLLDTRPRDQHRRGAVPGSLSVAAGKAFSTYSAWIIDPERETRPIVLFATGPEEAEALRDELGRVGIDAVAGYLDGFEGLALQPVPTVAPRHLAELPQAYLLDVRSRSEFDEGHIPGAHQLHGGRVLWHLDELPRSRPIVAYCQSGARSAAVASALRAAGLEHLLELEGSYEGWLEAQQVPSEA